MTNKTIILDFGNQYNQLIARRVHEFGAYPKLHPHTMILEKILALKDIRGATFPGGSNSVYDEEAFECDSAIPKSGIPILGICYGMQMIYSVSGGDVRTCETKEYGRTEIMAETDSPIFKGLPEEQIVWTSHGGQVSTLADGFVKDAYNDTCTFAATSNIEEDTHMLQFHPKVRHSEYGNGILKNFVFEVYKAKNDWSMHSSIDVGIEKIHKTINTDKVLLGLSGDVGSSVVAALLHKVIGDQLICMFTDHGLLHEGEIESVMETLGREMNINLVKIDAEERFLSKLTGVSDPEKKRRIIGDEFVYTSDEEVKKLILDEDIKRLTQGTLYTDVIKSRAKTAQTIKPRHNVGGLPEDVQFKLTEPLNTLFKDEVRALGTELRLSDEMIWWQPFLGPGLGIRMLDDTTEEKLEAVWDSDLILYEEVAKAGLQKEIWQYLTCLTSTRPIGVTGDQRTYDYAVAIRAVASIDGVMADWVKTPCEMLNAIGNRIMNEVKYANRIVYSITSKPPGTIEFE